MNESFVQTWQFQSPACFVNTKTQTVCVFNMFTRTHAHWENPNIVKQSVKTS